MLHLILAAANNNLRSGSCTMSVMGKGRLEAFSDGVFAIIITIMVLEMKVPQGESVAVLRPSKIQVHQAFSP